MAENVEQLRAEADARAKRNVEVAQAALEAAEVAQAERELIAYLLGGKPPTAGSPEADEVATLIEWGDRAGVNLEDLLAGNPTEVSVRLFSGGEDGEALAERINLPETMFGPVTVSSVAEFVGFVKRVDDEETFGRDSSSYDAGFWDGLLDLADSNLGATLESVSTEVALGATTVADREAEANAALEFRAKVQSDNAATWGAALGALGMSERLDAVEFPVRVEAGAKQEWGEASEAARTATNGSDAGVRAEYSGPRPVAGSGRAGQAGSAALQPIAPTTGFDPQDSRGASTASTAPAVATVDTPGFQGPLVPDAALPVRGVAEIQDDIARLNERRGGIRSIAEGQQFAQQKAELEAELEAANGASGDERAALDYLASLNPTTLDTTTPYTGTPRLSAADIQAANENEVYDLLSTQFGGFSFFLQKNKASLMVGLTADGMMVAANDPTAVTAKNVLDVIVEKGLTDLTRVRGALQHTEWWKQTDGIMRRFDAAFGEMSEPEKVELLEPVLDTLRDEARFLGFELSEDRARKLAEQIKRQGEDGDSEYIRGLMVAEGGFNSAETELSDFSAARDQIEALSRAYYVPIGTEEAAKWAEDVYVGTKSATQVEQYFKEMAINKFPTLKNAIEGGLTADQYFAPYKYEIEKMLDRPNVDMYEEFGDVIEYMPDTGGEAPRPMTLGEVRKYVRGLDEWQTSTSGQDSARSLAFAIGKTFGEVA
jgi:hypothetical protein